MVDILETFREKAADLTAAINRSGGIRATIDGLRRQMAEADRRRAMGKARSELKRLNVQINEMITAIGVQAVGLHQAGRLDSVELQPLCQHVIELKAGVAQQEAELAKLEALVQPAPAPVGESCPSCGKPVAGEGTFCPHCGASLPARKVFCVHCGAELRTQAKFCAHCGKPTTAASP